MMPPVSPSCLFGHHRALLLLCLKRCKRGLTKSSYQMGAPGTLYITTVLNVETPHGPKPIWEHSRHARSQIYATHIAADSLHGSCLQMPGGCDPAHRFHSFAESKPSLRLEAQPHNMLKRAACTMLRYTLLSYMRRAHRYHDLTPTAVVLSGSIVPAFDSVPFLKSE